MNKKRVVFFNFDDVSHELINILRGLDIEVESQDVFISKIHEETASKNILCGVNYYDNREFDSFRDIFSLVDLDNIEKLLHIYADKNYSALKSFEYKVEINYYTQKLIDKLLDFTNITDDTLIFFSCWDFNVYWICYTILKLYAMYGEKFIRSKIHIGGVSVDTDPNVRAVLRIIADNIHCNKSFPSVAEELFDKQITSRIFQTPTYKNILKIHYTNMLGCNNMCDFCINSIPKLYKYKIYPNLVNNNFDEEVAYYNSVFTEIKKVYVTNNTLNSLELKNILHTLIRQNNKFAWNLFTECCYIDDEIIELIKESKAFEIKPNEGQPVPGALFLGLDSTLPHVQDLILKKKTKYNNWFNLFNKLLDNKIGYDCQVLYGYPYYKYTMDDFLFYKEKFEALNSHSNAVFPILPLVKLYVMPEIGIFRWLEKTNNIQYKHIDRFNLTIPRTYTSEFTENNEKLYNSVITDDTYSTSYNFVVVPKEPQNVEPNVKNLCYVKYWQECNGRCSFCNQRLCTNANNFGKYIAPSEESLVKHTNLLTKYCSAYTNEDDKTLISLMGGELFHRPDIKELYKGFDYLIEHLQDIRKFPNTQIKIYSDLLFEDTSLLEYFVKRVGIDKIVGMKTSFDLYGRFKNNKQVDLYVKNLHFLCSICDNVQVKTLLTLDAIKKFNPHDYTFQKLQEIKNLPHTWLLDKYKAGNADDKELDDKFNIPNDWKNSNFFAYVNGELSISTARMKGSYRFPREVNNSVHFIMNGKMEKRLNEHS